MPAVRTDERRPLADLRDSERKARSDRKAPYAEGEMGAFVPGKVSHMGNLTQILADEVKIRLFTGYFFVSVPVRLNWTEGKLALAQHCFYQTGHGMAEGGCEMPVEGVERHPGEQELTFVRMFSQSGAPICSLDSLNIRTKVISYS